MLCVTRTTKRVQHYFYSFIYQNKTKLMKPVLIALLFVGAVACTTRLYTPTEANVNKVETASLAQLQQGHDLFMNNCGKCHKLPKPDSRSNTDWKKVLGFMAPKAKLNADQSNLIYGYLVNR
jgi:hypothetical protein